MKGFRGIVFNIILLEMIFKQVLCFFKFLEVEFFVLHQRSGISIGSPEVTSDMTPTICESQK